MEQPALRGSRPGVTAASVGLPALRVSQRSVIGGRSSQLPAWLRGESREDLLAEVESIGGVLEVDPDEEIARVAVDRDVFRDFVDAMARPAGQVNRRGIDLRGSTRGRRYQLQG